MTKNKAEKLLSWIDALIDLKISDAMAEQHEEMMDNALEISTAKKEIVDLLTDEE